MVHDYDDDDDDNNDYYYDDCSKHKYNECKIESNKNKNKNTNIRMVNGKFSFNWW